MPNFPNTTDFPKRLRAARGELTTDELAAKANVSAPYITHIEKGRRIPEADVMVRLCKALELDPAPFLEWCLTAKMGPEAKAEYARMLQPANSTARELPDRYDPPHLPLEVPVEGALGEDGRMHPVEQQTFAIPRGLLCYEVTDDSMLPLADPGSRALVDPEAEVRDGDLAIVELKTGAAHFRRVWHTGNTITLEAVGHGPPLVVRKGEVARLRRVIGIAYA